MKYRSSLLQISGAREFRHKGVVSLESKGFLSLLEGKYKGIEVVGVGLQFCVSRL